MGSSPHARILPEGNAGKTPALLWRYSELPMPCAHGICGLAAWITRWDSPETGVRLAPLPKCKISLARFCSVTIVVTVMANNLQFSIAVHILAGLACGCDQKGVTSSQLAASVNTSASFVRRTLAKLSKAGLIETATGKAGACWLAKDAKQITLLDIYRAVD